jgi:predicted alpha/beta-hydrolase family hydrolase
MQKRSLTLQVSDSIGAVSAIEILPDDPRALIVLAHGAGAGMQHQFMEDLARMLADHGLGTMRFNFPFTENKKGRPDPPAVAMKTISQALAKAHARHPEIPVIAAGKSFGGRMASHLLANDSPDFVKALIFYGFPLHAPGKAGTSRADHLSTVKVPMLFLQGTRDALADINLIKGVAKKLRQATLEAFEGADHAFKAGKNIVLPELVAATSTWLNKKV